MLVHVRLRDGTCDLYMYMVSVSATGYVLRHGLGLERCPFSKHLRSPGAITVQGNASQVNLHAVAQQQHLADLSCKHDNFCTPVDKMTLHEPLMNTPLYSIIKNEHNTLEPKGNRRKQHIPNGKPFEPWIPLIFSCPIFLALVSTLVLHAWFRV